MLVAAAAVYLEGWLGMTRLSGTVIACISPSSTCLSQLLFNSGTRCLRRRTVSQTVLNRYFVLGHDRTCADHTGGDQVVPLEPRSFKCPETGERCRDPRFRGVLQLDELILALQQTAAAHRHHS